MVENKLAVLEVVGPRVVPPEPVAPPEPVDIPAAVQRELARFIDVQARLVDGIDPELEPLTRAARDAVLAGGKRIRPTFAYWGWRGAAGPHAPFEDVVPALAALELLHAFALVHDDIMDRATTRRGIPTAHRGLADLHARRGLRGDRARFGDSAAILIGDLCLVWADQLIARSPLPPAALATARQTYDRMRVEAIAGQYLDVLSECARTWSIDQALRTARLKTASYTVTCPLLYGAALAGRSDGPDPTGPYTRFGRAAGEAFQLRDDLLGVYGEPALTGKPTGDDLALAKPTVLLQLTRTLATDRQAAALERALRGRRPDDRARIALLASDTGATARVEHMITERVRAAHAALDAAPVDDTVRDALRALATAAAWRQT